jgi:hypothetical protein
MKAFLLQILLLISIFSSAQQYTTIRVSVPNKTDDVFIVGNQENLGNWQADKTKMTKISDYQREISLDLKLPAEFKFTRGKWESEANIIGIESSSNIIINKYLPVLNFEIDNWTDEKKINGKLSLKYDLNIFRQNIIQMKREL